MKMRRTDFLGFKTILIAIVLFHFCGCETIEGEGGSGKISGLLIQKSYNEDYSLLISEKPAEAEDIYIKYGSNGAVAKKIESSETGYFEFPYLYPGEYTLFYASSDSTNKTSEKKNISITVQLKKGEKKDLGKLFRLKQLNFDDGYATIKGQIRKVIYRDGSQWPHLIPHDTVFAAEQEVYLTYNNRPFYDSRIRASHDGTFYFRNLIPGKYKVFLYSDRIDGGVGQATILFNTQISKSVEEVNLGKILTHKL